VFPILTALLGAGVVLLAAALVYSWARPNRAQVDPRLGLESWQIVADGGHNSNTDMILWRGQFLLVHAASPFHLGTTRSRLLVKRSRDGRAYWHEHGESILLRSADGREWTRVSTIHRGEANDETAIEFLPDARLLATARLEVEPDTFAGRRDASTLLAVSDAAPCAGARV
jgi:hypothetical protein